MFEDLREILKEFVHKVAGSRLFFLAVVFTCMFGVLAVHLFNLQIIRGEEMQNNYIQLTEETIYTPGTRGNIYDRNGKVLAYNELAYSVTVQDTGAYSTDQDMNSMLLRLVQILDKHQEVKTDGRLKADKSNPCHLGSTLPGTVEKILVKEGDAVTENMPLMVVEAMKMETTVVSRVRGKVDHLYVKEGDRVNTDDLLISFALEK